MNPLTPNARAIKNSIKRGPETLILPVNASTNAAERESAATVSRILYKLRFFKTVRVNFNHQLHNLSCDRF